MFSSAFVIATVPLVIVLGELVVAETVAVISVTAAGVILLQLFCCC